MPVSMLGEVGEQVVAVHGQSDQLRLLRPAEQRAALDRFAGPEHEKLLDALREAYTAVARGGRRPGRPAAQRPRAHQEADLLRLGPRRDHPGRPAARRGRRAERRRRSGWSTPRGCAPRRSWRTSAWPAGWRRPTRRRTRPPARHRPAHPGGAGWRRPGAGRAGRRAWRRRPPWSPTSPPSCRPIWRPRRRSGPAAGHLRAAGRAARADPQVRRRRRRRHRLGRAGPDPAGRAGHLRRAARGVRPGAGAAGRRGGRAGRAAAGARQEAAVRFADAGHRGVGRAGHAARPDRGGGAAPAGRAGRAERCRSTASSAGVGPDGADEVELRLLAHPGAPRCRCSGAPPVVSCPG